MEMRDVCFLLLGVIIAMLFYAIVDRLSFNRILEEYEDEQAT